MPGRTSFMSGVFITKATDRCPQREPIVCEGRSATIDTQEWCWERGIWKEVGGCRPMLCCLSL